MKRVRQVSEAAVISEFLKNEFYHAEFQPDRHEFERIVLDANIEDETENAIRRALLFRRRGHMWRELPADTEWWEVTLDLADLHRIHVFPRAHWRKIADGSFKLGDIVRRIRSTQFNGRVQTFISKIEALSYRLRDHADNSAVMLIGIDEESPVTILEGNHRLTAALLASPSILQSRFRVLCGFSPRMQESCWYQTNVANLWRYARNRLRNLRDREADVERVLPQYARQDVSKPNAAVDTSNVVAEPK
jgi:hypothetical protein